MIRTISPIDEVPTTWIFEHYCKLTERLHGQDVKIKSLFNVERTPSMTINFKDNIYRYYDFSSGKHGSGIQLVMSLFNLNYHDACTKIVIDYKNQNTNDYNELTIKEESKFKLTSHTKRKWNVLDAKYWTQFGISSNLLNEYNVFPLEAYHMSKSEENNIKEFVIKKQYTYGYFKANGEMYKLYQPYRFKFFNITPYVQGSDQLQFKAPTLIICSSLKDVMSLKALDFNIEAVAPNSENTILAKSVLSSYALKYDKIVTLFDNDAPGHTAMDKYKERYNIPGIYLKMSKDISDSVKDYGIDKVKQCLTPLI